MVESKFITKLPEHKSDTNYFGLDNTAERALLGYYDKFYGLLKETELGSTSGVMSLPGGLGHSTKKGGRKKTPNIQKIEQYLKLVLRHTWLSIRNLSQLYLKLSPVNPACSTLLKHNYRLSSPCFYKSSESSTTSLFFPVRVSLIF